MQKPVVHILLIITIGLLAYSNTFHVPFHFDDINNIVENPLVKDLKYYADPSSAKEFQLYDAFKSRFIGYLSFALNYQLNGLYVTGYHIANLSIHIINALLVYWVVFLTFRTPYFKVKQITAGYLNSAAPESLTAFFSALLFVSHPIQTQAVTYIFQRHASLATLFYLLSLITYIKFKLAQQETAVRAQKSEQKMKSSNLKKWLYYLTSLVCAALAMKTKEIAFTLPLSITLYEFIFFEGMARKRMLYLIPLIFTMLIIPLSLVGTDKPIGDLLSDISEATRVQTEISRWDYLLTEIRVIVTYIRLLFLPISQNLDYDYPIFHSLFEPEVFLSFLLLLSIIGLAAFLFYRSHQTPLSRPSPHDGRLMSFGILWFFITLSVESSIIPIVDVIFEHRMYLPSVGAFITITIFAFMIANKLRSKWPQAIEVIGKALIIVIILLAGATFKRNTVWKSEVSLWEDVVTKSPNKARGYNNLGYWGYYKHGMLDEAITAYEMALRIEPDSPYVYNNIGLVYYKQRRLDDAVQTYQKALLLAPGDEVVFNNLGLVYAMQGNSAKAIFFYYQALAIRPAYEEARFNLGTAYLNIGEITMAREQFEAVLHINPDHYQARRRLNSIN